jgi:oxalate decarboxylase/phosphoglucose isomerase-like protein (cupin superfamily)
VEDRKFAIAELHDSGDVRGSSFSVPAELLVGRFPVADMHIATIEPGAVRGNHYHAVRREILVVMAADRWSIHWDEGVDTPAQQRVFDGPRAVLVTIPTGMSHAIRNEGSLPIRMVGMTDGPYDADRPDAYPRIVTPT